jgi:energy-coupling factor transport system permease protein
MVWIASTSAVALLTRNPGYLLLLGVVAMGVRWRLTGERPGRGSIFLFLSLLAFPALLNVAFSRVGDTVLLRLPIRWIGGPYTLEALLFGLSAGIQIACLLTVMSVFGSAITAPDLLRRTPPGLYPVGVSASIGLTFAPQARKAFAAIREAQEIRGHQPRGWRDLPALVTPLVILSLESALGLAEGMVARGWGRNSHVGWRRWVVGTGWLCLAAGVSLWAVYPGLAGPALVLVVLGVLGLWATLREEAGRTRYRPEAWRRSDTMMTGLTIGVAVTFLFLAFAAPAWLTYYPYPRATWPTFQPALGAAIALLGIPMLMGDG